MRTRYAPPAIGTFRNLLLAGPALTAATAPRPAPQHPPPEGRRPPARLHLVSAHAAAHRRTVAEAVASARTIDVPVAPTTRWRLRLITTRRIRRRFAAATGAGMTASAASRYSKVNAETSRARTSSAVPSGGVAVSRHGLATI